MKQRAVKVARNKDSAKPVRTPPFDASRIKPHKHGTGFSACTRAQPPVHPRPARTSRTGSRKPNTTSNRVGSEPRAGPFCAPADFRP